MPDNIQDEKTQETQDEGTSAQPTADIDFDVEIPGVNEKQPPALELAPYGQLQDARAKLNSALGSIDGSDLAISKAEDQVILLEYEMETAQANVAVARQDALGFRQSLHDACDDTQSAIRLIRAKYPLA